MKYIGTETMMINYWYEYGRYYRYMEFKELRKTKLFQLSIV